MQLQYFFLVEFVGIKSNLSTLFGLKLKRTCVVSVLVHCSKLMEVQQSRDSSAQLKQNLWRKG